MNAWSLLYDVMSTTDWVNENGGYEWTPLAQSKGPRLPKKSEHYDDFENPLPTQKDNMPPWGHSDMEALGASININIDNNNGYWKYSEDVILKELRDYLSGTYRAHYANDNKTQTLDLIDSIGDSEAFCRSNAIKYLSRFGKKNGKSQLDILKAIHYCILLYHFSGLTKQPKGNYETF